MEHPMIDHIENKNIETIILILYQITQRVLFIYLFIYYTLYYRYKFIL